MHDDDAQPVAAQPLARGPDRTCRRALSRAAHEHTYVTIAIDSHDYEAVELAATSSAALWLAAHRTVQLLSAREGNDSDLTISVRSALADQHAALLKLWERAKRESAMPRMAHTLDGLRDTLATAKY